jgi:hypothetical protein
VKLSALGVTILNLAMVTANYCYLEPDVSSAATALVTSYSTMKMLVGKQVILSLVTLDPSLFAPPTPSSRPPSVQRCSNPSETHK